MCLLLLFTTVKSQQISRNEKLSDHPTLKAMYEASNDLRKKKGLGKHGLSEELTKATQDHAWYMARRHNSGEEDFNHRGDNGTPGKRASRFHYEGTVKENIARGYMSVEDTFEAWLRSDTHRDAIYSDTDDAGFGYAIAKDGTTYWVGVYGKPTPTWDLPPAHPESLPLADRQ
jgi:uncharacterized protein YkwD